MKSTKTTYLVRIALLMAITIVLAATPLGYIPAGVLSFTIMVLPVCIGGFFHIVSGQKHRKPVFGTKLHNNAPKKEARLRVQSGRGLVKNKNLGFVQKRTRNVNSPPLPAGELADGSVQKITEIEKFRKLRKSFFERFSVDAVQCGSTAEVFPNGQCLIQHGILKNNAEFSGNVLKIPLWLTVSPMERPAFSTSQICPDCASGMSP